MNKFVRGIVAFVLLSFGAASFAYNFTPTEQEWRAWPGFCQARYASTAWVKRTPYHRRVSGSFIDHWKSRVGSASFYSLHHYCAGISQLNRSMSMFDLPSRKKTLLSAQNEILYSYGNMPKDSTLFGEVATNLGRVYVEQGDFDVAERYFRESMQYQSTYSGAYVALALLYRKTGRDSEIILDILEDGNRHLNESSAEIHYFAGLVYVETQSLDLARYHAEKAYELGYPLPGLRNKLIKLGAWPADPGEH